MPGALHLKPETRPRVLADLLGGNNGVERVLALERRVAALKIVLDLDLDDVQGVPCHAAPRSVRGGGLQA